MIHFASMFPPLVVPVVALRRSALLIDIFALIAPRRQADHSAAALAAQLASRKMGPEEE
jgi:hypothetical protein